MRIVVDQLAELVQPPVDLGERDVGPVDVRQADPDRLQLGSLLAPALVGCKGTRFGRELLDPRERGGEDDARVVAQVIGQAPALGQLRAEMCRLVAHGQRDAGVTQGVEAGPDRELRGASVGGHPVGVDTELGAEVERPATGGQLEHVVRAVDPLERRTVVALHEPGDPVFEHLVADVHRDRVDELLAAEQEAEVGVVEDAGGARGAESCARDDHRLLEVAGPIARGALRSARVYGPAAVEEVGEQMAELEIDAIGGRRVDRRWRLDIGRCRRLDHGRGWRLDHGRGWRLDHGRRRGNRPVDPAVAEPCGVEAAQGVVEGHDVAGFRMVGGEVDDVVALRAVAQDIGDEASQRPLRADLDEHPRSGIGKAPEPVDELNRRGDLAREQVEHLGHHVGSARVEVAGDVGDDRQHR